MISGHNEGRGTETAAFAHICFLFVPSGACRFRCLCTQAKALWLQPARETGGIGGFRTRLYFLMREVPDEMPLERFWRRNKDQADDLFAALASFAARLHEAGFHHRDFSERHILTGRGPNGYTFRLIDLERASQGRPDDARAAADLKTLSASVTDDGLRDDLSGEFLDRYLAARTTPPPNFHDRVARARATKTFE